MWNSDIVGNSDVWYAAHMLQACGLGSSQLCRTRLLCQRVSCIKDDDSGTEPSTLGGVGLFSPYTLTPSSKPETERVRSAATPTAYRLGIQPHVG